MSDFDSIIQKRLYNSAMGLDDDLEDDLTFDSGYSDSNEVKDKPIDKGYEYLFNMRNVLNMVRNIKILDPKAEKKLQKWIDIIENDFNDLIDCIANYGSSIQISKSDRDEKIKEAIDRRELAHNNLMSSIVKTIRDIKFNFDIDYDVGGKNFLIREKYIDSLKQDQDIPDFMDYNEIEKISFNPNLFLPNAFNNCSVPNYKYLSDRRGHITQWTEDIYSSDIIKDTEKLKELFK